MADNIYLLETRLTKAQQSALQQVREVARSKGLTVFLVGGAVRDLISGASVRDLDVVVQGNALKLKKDIEKAGAVITGDAEPWQSFFVRFPGGVRMEIGSTLTISYPKPAKPVAKPAMILDDLRRRDFTANAMALSLNEGSYGLLMDPLNGVADIENRELRLVSNYGFIEDPVRMIRAARFMARLGWGMDEKTRERYETGKAEGYISGLSDFLRGYETEEIFYEEDPLRVMRRLEEEGWLEHLSPALSSAKANVAEMERLRESQAQLQIQGILANSAAANFPYLTAKMQPKDVQEMQRSFPRHGFVQEIEGLEARGKEFAARLGSKAGAQPSQAYRMIVGGDPEAVLWAAHSIKAGGVPTRFKSFYTEWPQAKQRIPYVLMQEMRITPDLPDFDGLVDKLFFELMDGRLGTVEEMKAFLEPYSPPAPPPPVSLRRARTAKKAAKPAKSRKKATDAAEGESVEGIAGAEGETEAAAQPADGTEGGAQAGENEPVAKASHGGTTGPGGAKGSKAPAGASAAAHSDAAAKNGRPAAKAAAKAPSAPAAPAKKEAPAAKKAAANAPAKKSPKPVAPAKKAAAPAKRAIPAKAPAKKAAANRRPAPAKAVRRPAPKPGLKKGTSKPAAKKSAPKKANGKAAAKRGR